MQLGFIGVGKMGGPMAGRLLDAGHTLTLFDVNAAALPLVLKRYPAAAPGLEGAVVRLDFDPVA